MNVRDLRIAIVGATGAVGEVALGLLARRGHPAENIVAMASSRSAGNELAYGNGKLTVVETIDGEFRGVDVAFVSATNGVSEQLGRTLPHRGILVIDDSAMWRMQEDVPLVVPEVNPEDVEAHHRLISIPNCTTTPLVMVLAALRKLARIAHVTVTTMQAVSGTGRAATEELMLQTMSWVRGLAIEQKAYPHQIFGNIIPEVGGVDSAAWGDTKEELKIILESRKILHDNELQVTATCTRVPVAVGHFAVLNVEFDDLVTVSFTHAVLKGFPGIVVQDDPEKHLYPMPLTAAGRDEVFVGRIRRDASRPHGLSLVLCCDNLRKGAALNALQILDEVVRRDCLKPRQ